MTFVGEDTDHSTLFYFNIEELYGYSFAVEML